MDDKEKNKIAEQSNLKIISNYLGKYYYVDKNENFYEQIEGTNIIVKQKKERSI